MSQVHPDQLSPPHCAVFALFGEQIVRWEARSLTDVSWTSIGPRFIEAAAAAYNRNRHMGNVLETIDRKRLGELCRSHGISRLALFGSAARGQLGPESDIDLLVEFIPGRPVGLRFITVQEELQSLLGRRVDLNTPAFLSPHFRTRVEAEAVPLYEAA